MFTKLQHMFKGRMCGGGRAGQSGYKNGENGWITTKVDISMFVDDVCSS